MGIPSHVPQDRTRKSQKDRNERVVSNAPAMGVRCPECPVTETSQELRETLSPEVYSLNQRIGWVTLESFKFWLLVLYGIWVCSSTVLGKKPPRWS